MQFDVALIGAGVVGALTARELSKYNIKVAVLEKQGDMAMGATKANSSIVHSGLDAITGTLKAKLNVRGTQLMQDLCEELDVLYKNNGSLVLAFSDDDLKTLEVLKKRGEVNGVKGLAILSKQELKQLEPQISDLAVGAIHAPSSGIVCPYKLTIAAVENAVVNGAQFFRNCEVKSITDKDGVFILGTSQGDIKAKYVINAAGVYSGEIAKMAGDDSIKIIVRHGDYYLLDKTAGSTVSHTIFQCPSKMGKGVLVSPTVDGNLIIGPTAKDIDEYFNTATTSEGLEYVLITARKSIPSLSPRSIITSFSGNRAHLEGDDFIIAPSKANGRLINAAGIESPGLSAAPAIAEYIEKIFTGLEKGLEIKADYNPKRPRGVHFADLNSQQRKELIQKNPAYGRIICRCETITEGEIIDSIKAPAGAIDVDGVKRRTRAGMGRCQGGFCGSKVVEILARELSIPINEVTKFGGDSKIIYNKTK
ncbi:MAG: NAD(P)/FAD-dependent oxidoreductase [Acutalibacteraceae bacterium]